MIKVMVIFIVMVVREFTPLLHGERVLGAVGGLPV
jgi:hypothetical protein